MTKKEPNHHKVPRFPTKRQLNSYLHSSSSSISAQIELFEFILNYVKENADPTVSSMAILRYMAEQGLDEEALGCPIGEWLGHPTFGPHFVLTEPCGRHFLVALGNEYSHDKMRKKLIADTALELYDTLAPTLEDSEIITFEIAMFARFLVTDILSRIEKAAATVTTLPVKATLFGSSKLGLSGNGSDLDIALQIGGIGLDKALMRTLSLHLDQFGIANAFFISHARIPMIECVDMASGIDCDITLNNTMGHIKTACLAAYLKCDPRVGPLIVAIKQWAKCRRINDAANGMLNSYGYTVMLLAFLQERGVIPPLQQLTTLDNPENCLFSENKLVALYNGQCFNTDEVLPDFVECGVYTHFYEPAVAEWKSPNTESLYQLLYGYFYHYGIAHDFLGSAVSARAGTTSLPMSHLLGGRPRVISRPWIIEDPFEPGINLCKASMRNLFGIYREFQTAAYVLSTSDSLFALFDDNLEVTDSDMCFIAYCKNEMYNKFKVEF
ncbi:hypothetical protein EC988_002930 [Linderina pennispora]|nr:hypothetical protein EC988_002930 [Linderina pennispora]